MMVIRALLASVVALATSACGQEVIRVDPLPPSDDRHAKMVAAIDAFVAANRTPAAYAELAAKVAVLRPRMDAALAQEAERRMLVLALSPVKAVADEPMQDQVNALALTVWPTLLAPPIAADALLSVADPKAQQIPPKASEKSEQYLLRLCFGPLASECKRAVPEWHGSIVAAVAVRRAMERVRIAVSDCLSCSSETGDPPPHSLTGSAARSGGAGASDPPPHSLTGSAARSGGAGASDLPPHSLTGSAARSGGAGASDPPPHSLTGSAARSGGAGASDPGWRAAVKGWEEIDRKLAADLPAIESRAHPDNWPRAGAAAEEDPGLPEAELRPRGELVVDGHAYGPNQQRIAVLRDLRGKSDIIALHFWPDTRLEQVRAVLVDARKAGCARVAVIAREPVYPYRRRVYYVADGYGLRVNLRPADSLQLLLHAVDEVAGPGTVVRVD